MLVDKYYNIVLLLGRPIFFKLQHANYGPRFATSPAAPTVESRWNRIRRLIEDDFNFGPFTSAGAMLAAGYFAARATLLSYRFLRTHEGY